MAQAPGIGGTAKMADPRWKNGNRSDWHTRRPEMDTPTCHGWTNIGQNEHGYTRYELGRAFMRTTTPEERTRTGNDWLVFIGPNVCGYNGSLAEITTDVRRMLGLPGPYFMPNYTIPLSAFGGDK